MASIADKNKLNEIFFLKPDIIKKNKFLSELLISNSHFQLLNNLSSTFSILK